MTDLTEIMLVINSGLLLLIGLLTGMVAYFLKNLITEHRAAIRSIHKLDREIAVMSTKVDLLSPPLQSGSNKPLKQTA